MLTLEGSSGSSSLIHVSNAGGAEVWRLTSRTKLVQTKCQNSQHCAPDTAQCPCH